MDIDIAFWIVIAVIVTGAIYLVDIVILEPKRRKAATAYRESVDQANPDVINRLEQEPIWVEYPKSFFPVLAVVLVLRSFLVEPFTIPSASMMPTLVAGDYILVNKFSYGLRLPVLGTKVLDLGAPERGDVLVFKYPEDPKTNYIKRVVGVGGDTIEYRNKRLWVNNQPVPREEVSRSVRQGLSEYTEQLGDVEFNTWVHHRRFSPIDLSSKKWLVPEGHYFVLGDNRDNSRDSRFWEFVPDELVVGQAFAIWMHLPGFTLPSFSRNGLII